MKNKNKFELLMVDWFSDAKLDIKQYKAEFYGKVFIMFNEQSYINDVIKDSEEEKQMLDLSIAFIYLMYHYPDKELMKRLYDLFYDRNHKVRPRQYFHQHTVSRTSLPTFPKFEFIQKTVSVIWGMHMRLLNNQNPFDELNKIYYLKYSDPDSLFRILSFIDKLNVDNKFIALLKLYCERRYDYKTGQTVPSPDSVQQAIEKVLKKEIDKYNDKNNAFQFDLNLYCTFDKLYHYKEGFKKWQETSYKERGKLSLNDFPELQEFIANNDKKKTIKHFVFASRHRYNDDKFSKKLLIELRNNLDFDTQFLLDVIAIYPTNSMLLIEELYIPLAEKMNISYDSTLRKILENVIITQLAKQSYFNFFNKIADSISDKTRREVVKAKYVGGFSVLSTAYRSISFHGGDTYKYLKRDLKNISKIIELSTLGIKYEFINDYNTYIKINFKGEVKKITFAELNPILNDENTGFQLIPVPIKIEKNINEKYYSGKNYLCGRSFLNKQQFEYLIYEYLPNNFPEININDYYTKYYKYNYDNPLTFEEYIKEKAKGSSSNNFLSDNNWKWFKEKYVDELPNAKDWYELMNVIIRYTGSKKPTKKWLKDIGLAIEKHGEDLYYKELRTLIENSINDDFWYFDNNRNALKGIAWSCVLYDNPTSLIVLKEIIAKAYTKVPNVGPRSAAIGNAALEVLIQHPNSNSFGILNLLRNQTKYARFAKILDKNIDKYIENSDEEEQILADKAIPDFDFVNAEKIVHYDEFSIKYIIKNKKLAKKWIVNSKETSATPAFVKQNHPKLVKEIAAEFKSINAFLKTTKSRIKTYWLYNRKWSFEHWNTYIKQQEMLNPWLDGLIWKNETQDNTFILVNNHLLDIDNNEVVPNDTDIISLWHPIISKKEEIVAWQKFIVDSKIEQSERQAFREYYPFSASELKLDTTPRFNHHFLVVHKLMALANAAGWIFTYVHEDVNWPRTYIKELDITAHLQCDYDRSDFAIPTKGFFITEGDTRKITYNQAFNKITFNKIPSMVLSEVCRDIDLFIAITSVAHDVELSQKTELLRHYREDFSMGKFSDNAQAEIRKQIIDLIGSKIGLKAFSFDKNYLVIKGKWNEYRINLGSGYAQFKDAKRHIPIIPDTKSLKKKTKNILPIKDDETLYIILAKAMFLQEEPSITDNKIIELLKPE